MSPERFKDIEQILSAVLNVSPIERSALLQNHCGDDLELRKEIESRLAARSKFETPASFSYQPGSDSSQIEIDPSQFIGKTINKYKILSLLGKGGMGAVYLAFDTVLERNVAFKMMSGEVMTETDKVSRFFKEAKSASSLNHPNILTVHEFGEFNGTYYIVSEFVEGRTVTDHFREGTYSLHEILEIALQIASALVAAHKAGIVHRDIKPDNIMIRSEGMVKVLDFGLAKTPETKNASDLDSEGETIIKNATIDGMVIGTPQYMSPEQARGQKVDARSDIFSFGVVLYQMLTGRLPFTGVNEIDVIGSILKDEPKRIREHDPGIPEELERLIGKALRKNRDERYQLTKELYIDLNDIAKSIDPDIKIPRITNEEMAPNTLIGSERVVKEKRFSIVQFAAFAVVAFGFAAAIWWYAAPEKSALPLASDLKSAEVVSWSSSAAEFYSFGSFSPDGKMVAYGSTRTGGKNIWIKQTTSGDSIQVTKDEFNNEQPIWSPTGEELAFFSSRGEKTGIWTVPVLGGTAKMLAPVVDDSVTLKYWSKNNRIYYETLGELYAIDPASGETTKATDLRTKNIMAESISFSRDEKLIAYRTVEGETFNIFVNSADGSNPKKVVGFTSEVRNITWHSDNQRLFFSAVADGIFQIFAGDINGAVPKQISFAERDCFVVDSSADGSKILFGSAKEESDVWSVDIQAANESIVASDINSELWANAAPDSTAIAYLSVKNLSQGNKLAAGEILIKKLGSEDPPQQIVKSGSFPVWSPTGQRIAYMQLNGDKYGIQTVDQAGANQKTITNEGTPPPSFTMLPYNRIQAQDFAWSPDGNSIAHVVDQDGKRSLQLTAMADLAVLKLTDESISESYIYCPIWSPNGDRIAFTAKLNEPGDDGKLVYSLFTLDVRSKELKLVFDQQAYFRLIGWSKNAGSLILASVIENPSSGLHQQISLLSVDQADGKMIQIASLANSYLYNIHLSPNAERIAYVSRIDGKDNIFLMSPGGGSGVQITNNLDSRLFLSSLAWSPDNNTIFFGKQSRYSLLTMLTNFI